MSNYCSHIDSRKIRKMKNTVSRRDIIKIAKEINNKKVHTTKGPIKPWASSLRWLIHWIQLHSVQERHKIHTTNPRDDRGGFM